MNNVIPFKGPKSTSVKAAARKMHTDMIKHVGDPVAVVVFGYGRNGVFAVRSVFAHDINEFDVLARAEAVINDLKMQAMEDTP